MGRVLRKASAYGKRYALQQIDYYAERGWSRPDKVSICLTHRCNARCQMCDYWKSSVTEEQELPASQWIRIIEELHSWIGPFFLSLYGGEVFLKRGIFDIIRRSVQLDLSLTIMTNAWTLRSERHLQQLFDTGLPAIHISIDGIQPAVHDELRGIDGLHDAATDVIRRIKQRKPQISVTLVCIVMRQTIVELPDYVRWAEQLGVDRVLFQPIQANFGPDSGDASWFKKSDRFIHDQALVRRIMDELIALRRKNDIIVNSMDSLEKTKEYFEDPLGARMPKKRCMLGQTNLDFDRFGNMSMCFAFDTRIGNANEVAIPTAWRSELAGRHRREIKRCRRPCMLACNRTYSLREKIGLFLKYVRMGRV